jgi:hypothetical protein
MGRPPLFLLDRAAGLPAIEGDISSIERPGKGISVAAAGRESKPNSRSWDE